MQGVTTGMREKGINNVEWIEKGEWRRKKKRHKNMRKH